jgi:uncharacterized protein
VTGEFRILSLDGGGAKGFYSLGVLREIEAMVGCRLCERFDMIFGTSTGAIIASLLGIGKTVGEIIELYEEYVPTIMAEKRPSGKSAALARLAAEVFKDERGEPLKFDAVKTRLGVVTTKWVMERPMIFKGDIAQAHGRTGTFVPGFGVNIGDAVQASCSAYPFFNRKTVITAMGDRVELIDGGYCANNPTLYAIADAVSAMKIDPAMLRVVSVGVGNYPEPKLRWWNKARWYKYILSVQLLQKTMEINTQSMDQLRSILFSNVSTIRISDTFERPEMATDLFEHDLEKLNILKQRGSESFAKVESQLKLFFQ